VLTATVITNALKAILEAARCMFHIQLYSWVGFKLYITEQ